MKFLGVNVEGSGSTVAPVTTVAVVVGLALIVRTVVILVIFRGTLGRMFSNVEMLLVLVSPLVVPSALSQALN